jgi:hypothetical protein
MSDGQTVEFGYICSSGGLFLLGGLLVHPKCGMESLYMSCLEQFACPLPPLLLPVVLVLRKQLPKVLHTDKSMASLVVLLALQLRLKQLVIHGKKQSRSRGGLKSRKALKRILSPLLQPHPIQEVPAFTSTALSSFI